MFGEEGKDDPFGYYEDDGTEYGVWRYYDKKGVLVKTINYKTKIEQ
jgi:antitoxin component YwqK of YwqJK toxin-antitoxin module